MVLSQGKALLLTGSSADSELLAEVTLPFDAEPAACVPLGSGTFCTIHARGSVALLQVQFSNGCASCTVQACSTCSYQGSGQGAVRDAFTLQQSVSGEAAGTGTDVSMADPTASSGAERPAHLRERSSGGAAVPACTSATATAHVSCAAALPCQHVPELAAFAALIVVGTVAGASYVLGLPHALLQAVACAGDIPAEDSLCEPNFVVVSASTYFAHSLVDLVVLPHTCQLTCQVTMIVAVQAAAGAAAHADKRDRANTRSCCGAVWPRWQP
jgi:hypothetical protein